MKKFILLLSLIVCLNTVSSQSFLHSVGPGFIVSEPAVENVSTRYFFSFHYYPQFTFLENESFSLSAGIPFTFGLSGSYAATYSSTSGTEVSTNTLLTVVQIPAMINFNAGAGSSKQSDKRFGYFVGGGFGYHNTGVEQTIKKIYTNGFGPTANAGVRFAVGSHHKSIEARLSFMKGLSDYKPAMLSLNAAFNF